MRRPSLGAIFLTVVLDLLGFGLVLPFLAEEARDGFHTTAFVGSLLGAVYSLMQFLFVPVWGRVSDRVGRRPVLVWSVGVNVFAMAGLGLAITYGTSVAWLFVARIVSGVATANLGTASAYIADITTKKDRARGMGMIGMAFGLGFILGPGVGGILGRIAVNGRQGGVACFVAAALGLVNFVWVAVGLPESLSDEVRARARTAAPEGARRSPLNLDAARRAFADPALARAILVNFLIILAFTNLDQTFRYFTKDLFGMDQLRTGLLLAFTGVVSAGVQGGLIRRLAKAFREAPLIRAGIVLQGAAFVLYALSPSLGLGTLFGACAVLAVGNGITQPTVSAFVSKRAEAHEQGAILGTNQSAASLARVVGPAFGGFVYGAIGPRSPYVAAALGMAVALFFALRLRESDTAQTSEVHEHG